MTRTVEFYEFEEARRSAGLFYAQALIELGISERTYYRWKNKDRAPAWALKIMQLLPGELDRHGWKNWYIQNGRLFCRGLNPRYASWSPGELLAAEFEKQNPKSAITRRFDLPDWNAISIPESR